MNCLGVKYISKYVHGKTLECWIIEKAFAHLSACPDMMLVGMCGVEGPGIRDHVNDCQACNQNYRIGKKTTTTKKVSVVPLNADRVTARLNQFRYSVPRDLRWYPSGRR
jgi:hypothetical protein